jgi:hypothetical protein
MLTHDKHYEFIYNLSMSPLNLALEKIYSNWTLDIDAIFLNEISFNLIFKDNEVN